MSLSILTAAGERLAGATLCRLVKEGAGRGAQVVLVPTFAEALEVQKQLAAQGIGLGVAVATPRSWARDLWDLWGDGRRVLDGPSRTLLLTRVLRQEGAAANAGTVRLLGELARGYLPWVSEAMRLHGQALTPAERSAVSLLQAYERMLGELGLIEESSYLCAMASALGEADVAVPRVALAGFSQLARAEQAFVADLARITDVSVLVRESPVVFAEQERGVAEALAAQAAACGADVHTGTAGGIGGEAAEASPRTEELCGLLEALFRTTEGTLEPGGAATLLEPSGPLAEAELVAREVARLAEEGAREVVVVVPDTRRAWRELAPKLLARGVSVEAQLSASVLGTEAGRAFFGFARTVAHLVELAKVWPAPREGADGPLAQVGPMDWWPPQELSDFLLCGIAHVDLQKARALDVAWRGDRLLSPADVLAQLQSAKATSGAVERATRELLRGRLGSAASKLLAPYVESGATQQVGPAKGATSLAREETVAVLAAVLGAASTLKELGVSADPAAPGAMSIQALVEQAELVLQQVKVSLRPAAIAEGAQTTVRILGRPQAAALPPASADAVVLCGLTSAELAVPTNDDALSGIVTDLGLEAPPDVLATQRTLFHRLCALARTRLLLERALFAADAHETYPAPMLTELLACYRSPLPRVMWAEDDARANLAALGVAPTSAAHEEVASAGNVDASLRRLVSVPQEGTAELPGGLPVLSASQLESYMECPLKWFSLRRLRLQDNDAGFGPLEMGTFAHRVLELTFSQLFEEGVARLDASDTEAMAHAHEVLQANFATHLEHQYLRVGGHAANQALIAHSSAEESQVDRLRRDLDSSLEYAAERFAGYAPYAFEWGFGRGKSELDQGGLASLAEASYAGVRVTGTVDRIDINGQGQALVIDYKHKGPKGFFAEYAAFGRKDEGHDEGFVVPRRIQALMYAQVVRRAFPNLRVVGALYLGTRGDHELSGAVEESQAEAVFGPTFTTRRAKQVVAQNGLDELLDATEEAVAHKVERLREGHIEADPIDAAACSFCPVANCERRATR